MQYFFDSWLTKQLSISTTLFLFWWRKLVLKKSGKQLNVVKYLTSVYQERRAVAVSRRNFRFRSGFPQKNKEEKFNNSEKFAAKKICHFLFYLFVICWHLICQISIESVRKIVILVCSLNVLMTVLYLEFFSIL